MKRKNELKGGLLFEKDLKRGENDYVKTFTLLYADYKKFKAINYNNELEKKKQQELKNKCIQFANYFFPIMTLKQLANVTLIDAWFMENILPNLHLHKAKKEFIDVIIEIAKDFKSEIQMNTNEFYKDIKMLKFQLEKTNADIRDLYKMQKRNEKHAFTWDTHS